MASVPKVSSILPAVTLAKASFRIYWNETNWTRIARNCFSGTINDNWRGMARPTCWLYNEIKIITSEPSFNQILNIRHLNLSEEAKEELNKRFFIINSGEIRLASDVLTLV